MSNTRELERRQGEILIGGFPPDWGRELQQIRECMQLGSRGLAKLVVSALEQEGLLGEFVKQVHVSGTMFSEITMAFRLPTPVFRADEDKFGTLIDSLRRPTRLLPYTSFREVFYDEDMLESPTVLRALDGATRVYPAEQEETRLQPPHLSQSKN